MSSNDQPSGHNSNVLFSYFLMSLLFYTTDLDFMTTLHFLMWNASKQLEPCIAKLNLQHYQNLSAGFYDVLLYFPFPPKFLLERGGERKREREREEEEEREREREEKEARVPDESRNIVRGALRKLVSQYRL